MQMAVNESQNQYFIQKAEVDLILNYDPLSILSQHLSSSL